MSDANPLADPRIDPLEVAHEAAINISAVSRLPRHDIALTLGSGWGGSVESLGEVVASLNASDVPGFSASKVAGHAGKLHSIIGPNGRRLFVIEARTHLYEGKGVQAVAHPVRTAAALGASVMILTNAAGSLDPALPVGGAVLIKDHINLTGVSALSGPQFVDLSDLYSTRLRKLAQQAAGPLPEAVYAQFRGPQYETPAEVRMAGIMGASLVGMSTAIEAVAAAALGMEVLGLSLVTNPAAGTTTETLDHTGVLGAANAASDSLAKLLHRLLAAL